MGHRLVRLFAAELLLVFLPHAAFLTAHCSFDPSVTSPLDAHRAETRISIRKRKGAALEVRGPRSLPELRRAHDRAAVLVQWFGRSLRAPGRVGARVNGVQES